MNVPAGHEASAARIRVLVVDDHAVVRDGITGLLADFDDIEVAGTAADGVEALARCAEAEVDVVLMDLSMPRADGVTATTQILERHPHTRVVALTGFVEEEAIRAVVDAGASACLMKTVTADELVDAVRGVVQGRSTFSTALLPHILRRADDAIPGGGLTARENDVLSLLAAGRTNREIATQLGLSPGTVRVYVSAVLAKLGVSNRTEAAALALRRGLIDDGP
jgi:DNA-binding NarL/FixJ family response regulator